MLKGTPKSGIIWSPGTTTDYDYAVVSAKEVWAKLLLAFPVTTDAFSSMAVLAEASPKEPLDANFWISGSTVFLSLFPFLKIFLILFFQPAFYFSDATSVAAVT